MTLALGTLAEAHGHAGARRLNLNRTAAPLSPLRALGHDRNIRSGDHFGWRQGDRRT